MSARAVRGFLPPSQGYICLSCRLQNAGVRRGQTRNYSYATNGDSNGSSKGSVLPKEIVESTNASSAGSRSFLKDMIRDLVRGRTETEGTSILSENKTSQDYINTPHVETEVSCLNIHLPIRCLNCAVDAHLADSHAANQRIESGNSKSRRYAGKTTTEVCNPTS